MPIATAAALKQHESPEILVDVAGTDLQIRCRRPDILGQLLTGTLALPILAGLRRHAHWAGMPAEDVAANLVKDPKATADFIDKWVCLVAVEPRVTLAAPTPEDGDAIHIDDLMLSTNHAIVHATTPEMKGPRFDAADFPGSAARVTPGPDGAAVRSTPLDAAGD
jgi:hypothetical protein